MILIEQKVVRTKICSKKGGIEMLQGKKLTYIRHSRNKGIGAKSGQPYDFANIILSDGLESHKMDMKPELAETRLLQDVKKGTIVNIEVDVYENFDKTAFIVSEVTLDSKVV